MDRNGDARSRADEADQRETERLTITPHPLRSHVPFGPDSISSPETPHPHSRGLSESKHLLPQSSKSLFQYSSTTNIDFGEVENANYEPLFPEWNSEPQSLRRSRRERWRDGLVDLSVVVIVLLFFALAAAIIRVNGKVPEGNREEILKQSTFVVCLLCFSFSISMN